MTVRTSICLTTDVDTLLYHMNNVRYLREVDFARADFYERSNLYRKIRSKGGAVVQGSCTIRYRRFIRPFSTFRITSKMLALTSLTGRPLSQYSSITDSRHTWSTNDLGAPE
uniref:Protein THEM6 n=1 Tax=Timema bartmani TaxID=61472 RepID=A0A7R9ELK3_9NEOP|nr:unnamed protein product [Timema bartmani]